MSGKFNFDKHHPPAPAASVPPEAVGIFDVEAELDRCAIVLQREIKNLMSLSSRGKLEPGDARDLVSYIKLLHELKLDDKAKAAAMTDDELLAVKSET